MGDAPELEISIGLLLSGIIGMLLLAVALVIFFVVYQKRLFQQQLLRREEEQQHQRKLLAAAVEIQENERRRIASDLHDDIGSLLSAARLYLRQFEAGPDHPENETIKTESLGIVSKMIQNTRRITHDLLPAELEKFGLFAAAEDLCDRLQKTGELCVHFVSGKSERFAPKKEVALFRVLQELTSNTLKHAQAQNIEVEFTWRQSTLHFRYLDDGKGFDTKITKERQKSGLGLRNIESRISLIGGELDYQTAPGEGLQVYISVPVHLDKAMPKAAS